MLLQKGCCCKSCHDTELKGDVPSLFASLCWEISIVFIWVDLVIKCVKDWERVRNMAVCVWKVMERSIARPSIMFCHVSDCFLFHTLPHTIFFFFNGHTYTHVLVGSTKKVFFPKFHDQLALPVCLMMWVWEGFCKLGLSAFESLPTLHGHRRMTVYSWAKIQTERRQLRVECKTNRLYCQPKPYNIVLEMRISIFCCYMLLWFIWMVI